MLPSLSALRADGRSALAPVGQSVATRAGARLFGKWLRRPPATGAPFYEQPGFDDYFNWCTSDNPDLGTAPEWYRSDKAAVLCAVEKDGMQLQYASDALKNDEQVVRLAFMQNKAALWYASRRESAISASVVFAWHARRAVARGLYFIQSYFSIRFSRTKPHLKRKTCASSAHCRWRAPPSSPPLQGA